MGRPGELVAMSKTLLIVEDNALNMKFFHDLLDAHGYDTLTDKRWHGGISHRAQKAPGSDPDGYPVGGSLQSQGNQMDEGRQ